MSTWSDYHAQAEPYRELDSDRVLVLIRHGGHGAASSVEVEAEGTNVFHLRDGKVVKLVHYWDRARALADLDLAPDGDSQR